MAGGQFLQVLHALMHLLLLAVAVAVAVGAPMVGPAVAVAVAVYAHSPIQRSPQVSHSLLPWEVVDFADKTEVVMQKCSAPMALLQF